MGGHRLARAAPIAWPRSRRVAFSFRGPSPTGVRVGGAPKQEECGPVAEGRRRSAEWEAAGSLRPPCSARRSSPSIVCCLRPSGRRLGGSVRSVNTALLVKGRPLPLLRRTNKLAMLLVFQVKLAASSVRFCPLHRDEPQHRLLVLLNPQDTKTGGSLLPRLRSRDSDVIACSSRKEIPRRRWSYPRAFLRKTGSTDLFAALTDRTVRYSVHRCTC